MEYISFRLSLAPKISFFDELAEILIVGSFLQFFSEGQKFNVCGLPDKGGDSEGIFGV